MKTVNICLNCGRNIYTNDLNLCKRCHQEVGAKYQEKQEPEEVEEEGPSLEELGLKPEEGSEEEKEETKEEGSETEDKKEEKKKEDK
jgi:hypothetical protein